MQVWYFGSNVAHSVMGVDPDGCSYVSGESPSFLYSHSCSSGCIELNEKYHMSITYQLNTYKGSIRTLGTLNHLVCKALHGVHARSETALLKTRVCAAVWNNGTFNEHTQSMELSTWVALLPPAILSQVTFTC